MSGEAWKIFGEVGKLPGDVVKTVDKTVNSVGDIVEGVGKTAEELPAFARAINKLITALPLIGLVALGWGGIVCIRFVQNFGVSRTPSSILPV